MATASDDSADPEERPVAFGDRLAGAVATMAGEADELAARRPHPDAHLYDIEETLRLRAADIEGWLEEAYYR